MAWFFCVLQTMIKICKVSVFFKRLEGHAPVVFFRTGVKPWEVYMSRDGYFSASRHLILTQYFQTSLIDHCNVSDPTARRQSQHGCSCPRCLEASTLSPYFACQGSFARAPGELTCSSGQLGWVVIGQWS
jgi:hypothetical protein